MTNAKQKTDFKLPVKRVTGETVEERLTENAHDRILPARYLLKDENGETVETPKELFERVAKNVAQPDKEYDDVDYEDSWQEFYEMMSNLEFMPNSPTLMNAGADLQQLSACFVVHPEDDMDSIFNKVHDAAKIFQSGGGMGYPFHLMRPKGDRVSSTGGIASGPLSFQQVFDTMCGTIKQGGCLSQDSRVMTSDGYIPLGELHNGRPNSEAPAEALVKTREGFNQAVQTHESGTMDVHTVITEDGYKLKAVYEHPVLSVNDNGELEFTRVDRLEEGDTIVYDQSDKLFDVRQGLDPVGNVQYHHNVQTADNLPEEMTSDLGRFLGLLWADGTFDDSNDRLVFSLSKDRDEKDWLKETVENWGLNVRVVDQNGTGKGDYWRVIIQSQHLIEWMKENELEKKLEEVPEAIYRSPVAIPAFLGGFTADGTVVKDADTVSYSLSNIETAENVQELLLLCGIASKITRVGPQEDRISDDESFRVRVNPGRSAKLFDEKVPHFFTYEFGENGGQRQNKIHFADKLVERLLNERFEKNCKLPEEVDRKAMKELRRYERGERVPSRERLLNQLEKVGISREEVPTLSEEHLFQRVAYNEEDDQAPIADIEIMNGAHEFVAANAVVHNKRRGAQMGIMRVNHPDILRFIVSKRKEGNLSNFNISVGLTDEFMEAVKNNEDYTLVNPRTDEPFEVSSNTAQFYNRDEEWYPEAAGSDQGKDDNFWRDFASTFSEEVKEFDIDLEPGEDMTLPARFIWETLVDGAWRNGEPGLFMYDETNKEHSFDTEKHPEHRIEATNPCGEQPLENYEACNLGHINLSLMVEDQGDGIGLDWMEWKANHPDYDYSTQEGLEAAMEEYMQDALRMDKFEEVAKKGTRFLDNVVTMSDFPLEEIEDTVSSMRKVGLGLMGFAQMLIQLGIEYGSDESIVAAKEIQRLITRWSIEESNRLADVRGEFDEWEKSKWANPTEYEDWFERYTGGMDPQKWEDGIKMRNHNTVTIAPTGTTSMIGNTSGGCEPVYSLAYFKNVAKDIQGEDMLVEFDDYFIKALEANNVDVEKVKEDAEEKMRNNEWEGIESISDEILPRHVKKIFKTSDQVKAEEHVRIQAAFQTHNHSGISKTCNFPNEATREDVREAYMLAYDLGIKGMTVYRDGTRDIQVMQTNQENTVTDMDTVDAISEMVEEKGGVEEFVSSEEFAEATGIQEEAGLKVINKGDEIEAETVNDTEDLQKEVTQENVEADNSGNGDHTDMGSSHGVKKRPKVVSGTTQEIETAYGDLFVTINDAEDNGPFEVFANLGKSGGYTQSFTQSLGRMTSLALRTGADAEEVVKQLDDIRSPQIAWDQGTQIHSVPDAIAEAMKRHMGHNTQQTVENFGPAQTENKGQTQPKTEEEQTADAAAIVSDGGNPECPECGGMLTIQEGCKKCPECGWSKC